MPYQLRRSVNCKVRAPLPEFRVDNMPVLAMRVGVSGVVQHVEEIDVETHLEALVDRDGLEQRSVQTPLADARQVLLPQR